MIFYNLNKKLKMTIKEKLSTLGTILDASAVFLKRTVIFIDMLIGGLFSSEEDPFQEGAILDLNIKGTLVEELSQTEFELAFSELTGESQTETLITDVTRVISHAKNNDDISHFLLVQMALLGQYNEA